MIGWTIISVSLCLLSIVPLFVFVLCCSKRRKNRKINKAKTKKGTKVATTPIEIKIESQINVDTSNIELQDFPQQPSSELPVIETSSSPSEKRIDETKSQHKHPIPSGQTSRSVKQTHTMYNIESKSSKVEKKDKLKSSENKVLIDSNNRPFQIQKINGEDKPSESSETEKEENNEENKENINNNDEQDWGDSDEDFDAIYDLGHDAHGSTPIQDEHHGSVLMHILSQVRIGMDLGKVTLPTFILERRSLLEMYADFFAHPDCFIEATKEPSTPESRFLSILLNYLTSFYPARKSGKAKKPYNPVLGEIFRCRWTIPGTQPCKQKTKSGPFPGSATNQVTFIAEQVSHHPPITAFYAEHPKSDISFNAYIYTKSVYLGLSIALHNIGQGVLTLHRYEENYSVTFPSAYGRAVMSSAPWFELEGKVKIHCEETQYRAEIEFHGKPLLFGKPHQISGSIYHGNNSKKPIMYLKGEWNGQIFIREGNRGKDKLFVDTRAKPDVVKECVPVMQQEEKESRRLWRHVTAALFHNNLEVATEAKHLVEQRQRDERTQREKKKIAWQTRYFDKGTDEYSWNYKEPLNQRDTQ
uniref:Oxysterol-binding protein n=1 Tax=Meloidogyne floridensis TaxID=298350 RepID=A0A915P2A1_9BILA